MSVKIILYIIQEEFERTKCSCICLSFDYLPVFRFLRNRFYRKNISRIYLEFLYLVFVEQIDYLAVFELCISIFRNTLDATMIIPMISTAYSIIVFMLLLILLSLAPQRFFFYYFS